LYKVDPRFCVLARNLLTKKHSRATLLGEPTAGGPEMALVSKPFSLACRAERLAGERAGPDGPIIRPSGSSEGIGPDADAGAEMNLGESSKLARGDVP
jgi:hypothetical protein